MASSQPLTRLQMEADLRSKVEAARLRYYAAVSQHQEALEASLRCIAPSTHSASGLRKAAKAKISARREYFRLLRTFSRLVIHGKAPEEE